MAEDASTDSTQALLEKEPRHRLSTEDYLSDPGSPKRASSSSSSGSAFPRVRTVVGTCLVVSAGVFAAFFFAPAIRSLLPTSLLDRLSSPSHPAAAAAAADDFGTGQGDAVRPVGPPGSITDETDHWASVGDPWTSSSSSDPSLDSDGMRWNGTHSFKKTVILVSLDGFRADYLDRRLTPHLVRLSERGLKAESMKPQFPTLTFPNHWSILTGLHAESHGVRPLCFRRRVHSRALTFGDRSWQTTFGAQTWAKNLSTPTRPSPGTGNGGAGHRRALFLHILPPTKADAQEGKDLGDGGEAGRQDCKLHVPRTAVPLGPDPVDLLAPLSVRPLPPSLPCAPTHLVVGRNHYKWIKKVHHVVSYLDMPTSSRPQLILSYLPELDQTGHLYGPSDPSKHVSHTLKTLDAFAESLTLALSDRNLTDIVDVVYVSDHGMTSTSDIRLVYLDELLGKEDYGKVTHKEGWPSAGLRFEDGVDTDRVLASLEEKARKGDGFDVYTHETMPSRWHFVRPHTHPLPRTRTDGAGQSHNPRIAPIYIVPHHGWAITDTYEHQVVMKGSYNPKGNHGYDNAHAEMQAIFVAHGPFAESVKRRRRRSLTTSSSSKWDWLSGKRKREEEERIRTIPPFENVELFGLLAKLLDLRDLPPTNSTPGFWDQYF